jgi:hypothetical protein
MPLPGILKILPGTKSCCDPRLPGAKEFYIATINHLNGKLPTGEVVHPLRIEAFDIETGVNPSYTTENPFGIKEDKAALSPYTNEILLSGFMNQSLQTTHFCDAEPELLAKTLDRLTDCHQKGGIVLGQNLVSFDLRMAVLHAARRHGLSIPSWLTETTSASAKYRLLQNRIIDTCRLFSQFSKFSPAGTTIKLAYLARFWGRSDFESEGATFGTEWRNGDPQRRKALIAYNTWNLADSLVLAMMSGALDSFRPSALPKLRDMIPARPKGLAWNGCDYQPDPAPIFASVPETPNSNVCYFDWITAPTAKLLSEGPFGGWAKRSKDKTRLEWPFGAGRQNAFGMQIVGFVAVSATGIEYVWNPGDEFDVIAKGLAVMDARRSDSRCFTDCVRSFRSLLTFRASLYNVILEPWVNGFRVKEWLRDVKQVSAAFGDGDGESEDTISRAAVSAGMLNDYADIDTVPTYCGQDATEFKERAIHTALAARHYIVTDPWTVEMEASPFPVETF